MSENKELKLDFILKELTLSPQAEEAVPGSSSSVELQDQRLVCVEYPAVVSSADRMLETLGGERAVSKVSWPSLGHNAVALKSWSPKTVLQTVPVHLYAVHYTVFKCPHL